MGRRKNYVNIIRLITYISKRNKLIASIFIYLQCCITNMTVKSPLLTKKTAQNSPFITAREAYLVFFPKMLSV